MPDYLIEPSDPTHPDAIVLLAALSETLAALTGSSGRQSFNNDDVRAEGATFLLARNASGTAIGCVACRPLKPGIAEIKRLFALPDNPGAGSQLLSAAERFARGRVLPAPRLRDYRQLRALRRAGGCGLLRKTTSGKGRR